MNTKTSLKETLQTHLRAYKDIQKRCPGVILATSSQAILKGISPYLTIYFSAQLINELSSQRRPRELMLWVGCVVGTTALLGLGQVLCKRWYNIKKALFKEMMQTIYTDQFLSMDYAEADRHETRDLYNQIKESEMWRNWGFNQVIPFVDWTFEAITGILGAIVLTVSLFTQLVPDTHSLCFLNSAWIVIGAVLLLIVITCLGPLASNHAIALEASLSSESRFGNRLFSRFTRLGYENQYAMDHRMYHPYELSNYYMRQENRFGVDSRVARLSLTSIGLSGAFSEAIPALFSGVVYVFVCLKALGGAFGIGSVTQYVSAVTALSINVALLLETVGHMKANTPFLKTTYAFLDIPHSMYQGSLTTEKRADRDYEIEFKDVSFKYPGSDLWALHHVNMKFKIGSRIAVVGENGSGKSTFIKLLCRLYDPQEGVITLNGIDVRKYRYQDYLDLFSVVFQDFQLLSQPLGDNVAGSMHYDKTKVEQCLKDAGFEERLRELPEGLDTYLYRDFGKDGIEVSGGEAQKIAIARALYKDAPFIILDEPTAALDPLAEAEIYSQFNAIVKDKTAIFISHRLSSCQFCDEILVFDQGTIVQKGTHATLVHEEKGKYSTLWHAQAQYYE